MYNRRVGCHTLVQLGSKSSEGQENSVDSYAMRTNKLTVGKIVEPER
jgi:hypothetical protein